VPDPPELPPSTMRRAGLRSQLEGRLYTPRYNRELYDIVRKSSNGTRTYNTEAMGKPVAIATCRTGDDVATCVRYVVKYCFSQGIKICVSGGRHSSQCMRTGSFVIDLSGMRETKVNEAEKYIDVQGGALWDDVCKALMPHNLATTMGTVGSTGVGGLALIGGNGYLQRLYGLVIDNLMEADVVTASGDIKSVSATENADLFWAIKGGSGNFGVVTRFRLKLHNIPEKIFAGTRIHAPLGFGWFPERKKLIQEFMAVTGESGDNKSTGLMVLPCGGPVVEVLMYIDEAEKGKEYFKQHRKKPGVAMDRMKPMSYYAAQKLSPDNPGNYYFKGKMLTKMTPKVVEALAMMTSKPESPGTGTSCAIVVMVCGGESQKPGNDAYCFRDCSYWIILEGKWSGKPYTKAYAERRAKVVSWIRRTSERFDSLSDCLAGKDYGVLQEVEGNLKEAAEKEEMKGDIEDVKGHIDDMKHSSEKLEKGDLSVSAGLDNVYGKNLERLRNMKHKYDPDNLFAFNDNVMPKAP